ncbi:MAG: tetratricopeptide repeat protein [Sphingomonadaceae bacterium]
MRITPIAVSIGLALATMASAGHGQKPDDQIDPLSLALSRQGEALTTAGRYSEARDALETALAVDPRNRAAFIGLARIAQNLQLPGKAIRYYGRALALEPNDLGALSGQGEALVQRGAIERAKQNLARIRALCKTNCPQAMTLAETIAAGPPAGVATAQAESAPPANDN